jgi:hypothetical protein
MKNNCFKYSCLLLFLLLVINCEDENSPESTTETISEVQKLEKTIREYLSNPAKFILTNSNKENFISIFSNFTKMNGEEIYEEYIATKYHKDLQSILDDINGIKFKNVNGWNYDHVMKKFILPDDGK